MSTNIQHKIRSFVMRAGKLTQGQKRAISELFPAFSLDTDKEFNAEHSFGNNNPVIMDIGFGNGESLIHIAQMYPQYNFIGIEVHTPGIGHLLLNIEKLQLKNIRIYQEDSVEILTNCIPDNSMEAIHIYFPDPWHKKRHHKRRLIQNDFIQLVIEKLTANARLHLATDWQEYALHMQEVASGFPQLTNIEDNNAFTRRPVWRPVTKFERRGIKLGHKSYDLIYKKNTSWI